MDNNTNRDIIIVNFFIYNFQIKTLKNPINTMSFLKIVLSLSFKTTFIHALIQSSRVNGPEVIY